MDLPAVVVAEGARSGRIARSAVPVLFGAAILVGATLVFLVQPMAARMVLPLFGGSQAVWTTSMLFFQGVLLAGYGYAHASTRLLGPRRQPLVHAVVLVLPLAALPIGRGLAPPPPDASPSLWLLGVLVVTVGAPFVVLTTASPLLQRWLATSGHASGRDPYFLYALGNAGSLLALLGYPVLVEPWLTLDQQARMWSAGYVGFALLALGCVVVARRGPAAAVETARSDVPAIAWRTRARWIAIALVPSSLMLGVTTELATDVASAPLLWVLPLATYLLTFVVAFSRRPLVTPALAAVLLPVPAGLVLLTLLGAVALPVPAMVLLHVATLFLVGALAHGRLAAERPPPERLTEFYFLLSLGGVLGGALNALVAPHLFDSVLEYPLVLGAALLLRPGRSGGPRDVALAAVPLLACLVGLGLVSDSDSAARAVLVAAVALLLAVAVGRPRRLALGFLSLAALLALAGGGLHAERTFFGVLRVVEQDGEHRLYHGTTLHGVQRPGGAPLSYYTREGPLGDVVEARRGHLRRVDAIGLGVGTLAAYGTPGQRLTFYELDPAVVRIASHSRYFTFLRDSRADVRVVVGDGRRTLATAPDGASDLVVVDAFSSDSVPVHLLTREAMELYVRKLRPGGLVAFHVTNRHLDLAPVVAEVARHLGLPALERDDTASGRLRDGRAPSRWLVVARSAAALEALRRRPGWHVPEAHGRVWTDDYSNLLSVVRWTG
ncbi:MAG TPA: fused MFS/spermidine synthase [Gaiellaceae bacterium]|nr:fused MFS/spermidine synthase [Gaiellaceae bacterium]